MSELTIEATHRQLRLLRPWLESHLPTDDTSLIGRIELCVHELATNVVDHSEAERLSLHLDASPDSIEIEMHDQGLPVELPATGTLEAHPRVRGYGMSIAEQLASDLAYERRGDTNLWRVRFDLA